jgi:hypothetical protein
MENRKYQIFVSSTYKDLIAARTKVIATILSLYHFPIGMEMYSADDDEQWQVIKETIDFSDYYIVIIGHRYGSLTKEGISFTEKEFLYAKSKGIPILSFIRERDVLTTPEERETDPANQVKLDEFIKKAESNKMCDYWNNDEELGAKVAIALSKFFSKRPRVGWKRSDSIASPEILEEMSKLSKENRDLREELTTVYQQLQKRKPELVVDINDTSQLTIKFQDELIRKVEVVARPQEIYYYLIGSELTPFVEEKEVESYNDRLPSKEEVDRFNSSIVAYARLKETSQSIKIGITNSGTMRATDIHIDLEVPEGLLIIRESDLQILERPEITFPKNPLDLARNKMIAKQKGLNTLPDFLGANSLNTLPPFLNSLNLFGSSKFYMENISNNIHLHYQSLLHTRAAYFDYLICPLRRGEFIILFQIICDEYPNPEIFEVKIDVV